MLSLILSCVESEALDEPIRLNVIGGPCEGCETIVHGMPSTLAHRGVIAPESEPGQRMMIAGRVLDESGEPVEGVIVYAYHTDQGGIYPRSEDGHRHGRLRGWVVSDAAGEYAFDTIRPGGYPSSSAPAHVHMHLIEPGGCSYYIDDIFFTDDPRLTESMRRTHERSRGGSGVITPEEEGGDGSIVARRDIVLGANVPGYDRCAD